MSYSSHLSLEPSSIRLIQSSVASASDSMYPLPSASVLSLNSSSRSPDYDFLSSTQTVINEHSLKALRSTYFLDPIRHGLAYDPSCRASFAYKLVARKVHSILGKIPEEFQVVRHLPDDPLAGLEPLPTNPPDFVPGVCFTQERADALNLDPAGWLWPEELKLVRWIVRNHEVAFTWDPSERGCFDEQYFPPVKIPTVPHTLWVHKNIPLPPTIKEAAIKIIKDRIASGVYEPSTASYCSHWFCVLKQDGKSWHLVHDLQPLNAVTIRDASLPPFVEHFAESFAGYAVYGMLDLFAGFDQRPLHPDSRDLTSFLSPVGNLRHIGKDMGNPWISNSQPIPIPTSNPYL